MKKTRTVLSRQLSFSIFLFTTTIIIISSSRGRTSHSLPAREKRQDESPFGDIESSDVSMVYLPFVANGHAPSYVLPFGATLYGDVNDAQGVPELVAAGGKWVTTMLHWSDIEPVKGYYDWSSFDTKAQNAQAAGIDLFVLFTGNPYWAAQYPGGPVYNLQTLVGFTALMAERYDCDGVNDAPGSPCVHYWSFYAEPDNGDPSRAPAGKGYWGHNGAGYAAMLAQVSPAIHQANPKAKVMIGGIAYDYFEEDGGPFVRSFLADTLNALKAYPGGVKAYLDAITFHFYPISVQRWPTIRDKALAVRGIAGQYGAGDLPLTCPEMGYWSDADFGSSETIQANRLVQMYVRGASVGLVHMAWHKIFDEPATAQYIDQFGLFRAGNLNSPKQSYWAYQVLTRELAFASYQRQLQAANIEGYVFHLSGRGEKSVLWATATSATMSFVGSCQEVTQVLGATQKISDGKTGDLDGSVNGQVRIQALQNKPIYVEACP